MLPRLASFRATSEVPCVRYAILAFRIIGKDTVTNASVSSAAAAGGAAASPGPSPGGEAAGTEALQVSEENAAVLPLLNVAGALLTSSRAPGGMSCMARMPHTAPVITARC